MAKKSKKNIKGLALAVFLVVFAIQVFYLLSGFDFPILKPSGWVAEQQRNLIVFTMLLSLVVIIPVFYMLIRFVTKYDEKNAHEKYSPELDGNTKIEFLWWTIPIVLMTILGVVTFKTSHSLDPFKPLVNDNPAMTIQVVALDWKWLFIYPEQKIASVNYVKIPTNRPVEFKITSDASMNSFWIPDLGGQIYAMSGMSTEINLIADKSGEYKGSSANLSGKGFAGMKFTTSAVSQMEFDRWASEVAQSDKAFNSDMYERLSKPSENEPTALYRLEDDKIFDNAINKYMNHGSQSMTMTEREESR